MATFNILSLWAFLSPENEKKIKDCFFFVLNSENYENHIFETTHNPMKEKLPPDQASLSIYTSNFYLSNIAKVI